MLPQTGVLADSTGDELAAYLAETTRRVDAEIARAMDDVVPDRWMRGAIGYHLGWTDDRFTLLPPAERVSGGKRLRPALALLSYQARRYFKAGEAGDTGPALPFAAAIDLIHNFSLIHDDIEDGDRTRRGRPTLWTLCGQPQAINVGDTLHALAYDCIARHPGAAGYPGALQLGALVAALAKAVVDMTIGQRHDMSYETEASVDMEMYLHMIAGKTAALTACATSGGALLGGADDASDPATSDVLARYYEFGRYLGLGFQIRDDLLGIWGDWADTGKPEASDLRRRKKTLPVIFALAVSAPPAQQRLRHLYTGTAELRDIEVAEIREVLDGCHAGAYAQTQVQHHAQLARQALVDAARGEEAMRENPYLVMLERLTDLLISRIR